MAKLDIYWLKVFIEIHRTRSVSLAAEKLGMAQPRVSGVLRKLRRHFHDPLFAPTSQGMEPTTYAAKVYPDIVQSFERLSTLDRHRDDFDPTTAGRQFRICMSDISEIVVLPMLVNELRRVASGVGIEAERISPSSADRLRSGEVDLAIGYMPSLEAGFYQQTLFKQGFVCLASLNHPRVQATLTRDAFLKEGHILVETSGTGHAIVDREFNKKKVHRNVVLRVPSFLAVARLVSTTELLATVPRRLGEALANQERIQMLAPPIALPFYSVKLHWHARFHTDLGNIWLRKVIARVMSS